MGAGACELHPGLSLHQLLLKVCRQGFAVPAGIQCIDQASAAFSTACSHCLEVQCSASAKTEGCVRNEASYRKMLILMCEGGFGGSHSAAQLVKGSQGQGIRERDNSNRSLDISRVSSILLEKRN